MAIVWVPPQLRRLTGGSDKVTASGNTLGRVISSLEETYPGIKDALLEANGREVQPGIAVVIGGEVSLLGLVEPVGNETEIHFIPAISGG